MINTEIYKNKKIAVFGLGKAGVSAVCALNKGGAKVYALDDNEKSREAIASRNLPNVRTATVDELDWQEIDILVLSPGVPFTHPEPHAVVKAAQEAGCRVICDIEILYESDPQATYIGITGTNGKSTTTALTGHILKECSQEVQVGGNIGIPVLDLDNLGLGGTHVIEMSSYQLDLIDKTRFNISVLLNVTPDHIDRHGDLAGYIKAKCRIYKEQGRDDYAIISVDDEHCQKIYDSLAREGKIGNVIPISTKRKISGGIAIIDGIIYDSANNRELKLGELVRLRGEHNAQNIAASYASASILKAASDDILKAIHSFQGLPHRMEYVVKKDGILYINDSKATNAEAASKALSAYDNIYWIAGGVPKEGGIEPLKEYFPKIKKAFLIGQAQDEFAKTVENKVSYLKCGTLENALSEARKAAMENSANDPVVLLSPACASFDQWPNFEVRGQAFCDMVKAMSS